MQRAASDVGPREAPWQRPNEAEKSNEAEKPNEAEVF